MPVKYVQLQQHDMKDVMKAVGLLQKLQAVGLGAYSL
jgi:hypothetical protein